MKQLNSAKARQWQSYNRWRANHRALDRQRRLERMAAKPLAEPFTPSHAKPPRPKAWARIRITFADGTTHNFSVRQGPFGLLPSPTKAANAIRHLLSQQKPCHV